MLGPCSSLQQIAPLRALRYARTSSISSQLHPIASPVQFNSRCPQAFSGPGRTTQRRQKSKVCVSITDLPQGLLPLDSLTLEKDDPSPVYPTVAQQARNHMDKFDNCVLLTRVGGFYELYFEHAEELGPLLNLKVATRKPSNAPAFPMAGFPFFQLDKYLKILVQDHNRYVAIAEEFSNDVSGRIKAGGLMNDRRVARVITPGTLIDETFMDPLTNHYILAIHLRDHANQPLFHGSNSIEVPRPAATNGEVGLAWLDLSTGHFFTNLTTIEAIPSFLARISPKEIVLDKAIEDAAHRSLFSNLIDEHCLLTYTPPLDVLPMREWSSMLESPVPTSLVSQFSLEETIAGSTLLQYVVNRTQGTAMKLQPPVRQVDVLSIDKSTMRALELKKTMREDVFTGSLLHTMRRTVTKGGGRLLESWLSSPSTSLPTINARLDLVTHMLSNKVLREHTSILLRRTHDSHRLLQKFAFGRGDPDDLLALANTILATHELANILLSSGQDVDCIKSLVSRMNLEGTLLLANKIRKAIDEEGLVQQHHLAEDQEVELQNLAKSVVSSSVASTDVKIVPGSDSNKGKKAVSLRDYNSDDREAWTMRPAASPTLSRLHSDLGSLAEEKDRLSQDLCLELGASSLTLRFTPGLGHICHVKGKDTKLESIASSTAIRNVGSSKSTRSFHHTAWTALGNKIIEHKARIRTEEARVFNLLRRAVILEIVKLRRNASVLDELDIACSFATLAQEKNWVRPSLDESLRHNVIGGRHPAVEEGLEIEGRTFVTNDCSVGSPKATWLITGPNMAGKSTFLRQNALITILAQVGSYVPASFAEIGLVDQIFSRVGSADNLYKDQSTFMVEMLETANILKKATKRSFVIMDEIGRGTTPEDGTAVAYACLWHLTKKNRCRTLFATHFHALADIIKQEGVENDVAFWCTDVAEDDSGGFRYVHKLKEGVNRQSHALKVATLSGMPDEAIHVARQILEEGGKKVRQYDELDHNSGHV